ncbi:MAG: phospholipase D-like domain-containing protein [Chloroflexi bacterium]|nr:phospholipase D-like domain-containing protein [Chloroflexota bacterium]
MVNALITLKERGIPVRIVTDEDNGDLDSIRRLRRNGLSVIEDKRSGLMHNKFIIIDGHIVYTGSLNYTTNGVYCNNNNLVRIDSSRLAANYIAEMDEMADERQFGPTSPKTPAGTIND